MTKKIMIEIRAMGLGEAREKLFELRSELAKERAVIASGTRPENPGNVRKIRRDIARTLTAINEKRKSAPGAAAMEETAGKKTERSEEEKKAEVEQVEGIKAKEAGKKVGEKKGKPAGRKARKIDVKKVKKSGNPRKGLKKKKEVKK